MAKAVGQTSAERQKEMAQAGRAKAPGSSGEIQVRDPEAIIGIPEKYWDAGPHGPTLNIEKTAELIQKYFLKESAGRAKKEEAKAALIAFVIGKNLKRKNITRLLQESRSNISAAARSFGSLSGGFVSFANGSSKPNDPTASFKNRAAIANYWVDNCAQQTVQLVQALNRLRYLDKES